MSKNAPNCRAEYVYAVLRLEPRSDGSLDSVAARPNDYVTLKELLPTEEEVLRDPEQLLADDGSSPGHGVRWSPETLMVAGFRLASVPSAVGVRSGRSAGRKERTKLVDLRAYCPGRAGRQLLLLGAAATDDLCESHRHERLLTPRPDATPITSNTSNQAKWSTSLTP
jgi:hypothetical protein